MALSAYYMSPEGALVCDLGKEQIKDIIVKKEGLLWVDIEKPYDNDRELLEQDFSFHHLAVEDCLYPDMHPPKIDDFDEYLFMIFHGIDHQTESDVVETAEIALFLGPCYVVSVHHVPLYSLQAVKASVDESGRWMMKVADFLAHAIIDALIDNVLPTIDLMSDVADLIEDAAVRKPVPDTIDSILKLKRSALRIHRIIAPQREILNRLSRGEFSLIKEEAEIFYRDIYDHLIRIEDLNQTVRDMSDNALSTYLSSVANKQNDSMRMLAVVATIFMPLTLLAGIYGMNFEYMPELKWHWAYFCVLGIVVTVISVMVWRFWANKWIMWGRGKVTEKMHMFSVTPDKLTWHIDHIVKRPRQ
jgi:magnesium transporter